jgi:hypothetical protein
MLRDYLIANSLASADPADVRSLLAATVELSRDSRRKNITDIAAEISMEKTLTLSHKLQSSPLAALMLVVQAGVNFCDPQTIAAVKACEQADLFTAEEAAELLSLGIKYGPEWQRQKLDSLPSVEEIAATQKTIATEGLREEISRRYHAVREAVDTGEVLTIEAAKTKFGEG